LIRVGLCDGMFDEAERQGVRRIAEVFGLESDVVGRAEAWVREGLAWVAAGEAMLAWPVSDAAAP
jgi:hypothetical protein